MLNSVKICWLVLLLTSQICLDSFSVNAQAPTKGISIKVTSNKNDWKYNLGEQTVFWVQVFNNGKLLNGVEINYEIGPDMMKSSISGSLKVSSDTTKIKGGTLKKPGFLRCTVTAEIEGKKYTGLATSAYEPEGIRPTVKNPSDFTAFWDLAKREAAKIPMDVKITPLPELSTGKVKTYMVSLQNFRIGSRIYGILCVPNKPGKFPAVLEVPGAGIRAYKGNSILAEKGLITFQIGIHGIPVNLPDEVYANLYNGALNSYPFFNVDNRDTYYYKRVYMGCVRAIDFLTELPEYDGKNLAVSGGSQGGALSIVTAALDSRVKYLRAFYPALSDVTGYLHQRAGGWPHLFSPANVRDQSKPDKIATIPYYDVVNFARLVKVPGFYSWGFNDVVCPPTSMYAAYNVITAPKELMIAKETGHNTLMEQINAYQDWLVKNLLNK